MTTALTKLRDFAAAARRDILISTAEADILDFLARVAEYEEDERIDGALEELADNLRRALDKCVDHDDADDIPDTVVTVDADDIPDTGCPTCDTVLDTLAECHGMSLRGTTAAEVAASARDWIGDLIVERDNMRAERDSLHRAQHEAMQHLRPIVGSMTGLVLSAAGVASGYRNACRERDKALAEVASLRPRPTRDELADYARRMRSDDAPDTSAPTVGATDAGPDAPALIVEGDAAKGAPLEGAVPAAPVSGAEQSCGETGVDRPRDDERIVGPREGEDWTGPGCHAGTTPYGYRIDPDADEPVLLTDQAEAAVMIVVLEGLALGQNAGVIAQRLNRDGSRTRTGAHWTPSSVRGRILSADEWQGVEVGR